MSKPIATLVYIKQMSVLAKYPEGCPYSVVAKQLFPGKSPAQCFENIKMCMERGWICHPSRGKYMLTSKGFEILKIAKLSGPICRLADIAAESKSFDEVKLRCVLEGIDLTDKNYVKTNILPFYKKRKNYGRIFNKARHLPNFWENIMENV